MKKKFLITILSLVCVLGCAFALAACGNNNQPPVHNHEWSQTWSKDDTHHWHNCTASDCDITENSEKDGYAEHDISSGDCVCGYKPSYTVGLEYRLNSYDGDKSYIVKGIGTAKDTAIIIPATYNGKPVKRIDSYAFNGCDNLTSITIPDGVTDIDSSAFKDCISLTNISIPDSVTNISNTVFSGCSKLTNFTVPVGVTSIYFSVFSGCSSLTSITIHENVTVIGDAAFKDCISLASITLPDGITEINNSMFSGCSSITNITIPEGVKIIAASAFKDCTSLTNITIPNNVTKIYAPAFSGCSSLTNVTVQNGATIIERGVFDGCPIETATIPTSACSDVKNPALKTVVITSGETIYDNAFGDCTNLESITIAATVTRIGDEAFFNCTSLTNITFNGTKEQWNHIQVGSNWSYKTGDFTVHCTDGEIAK